MLAKESMVKSFFCVFVKLPFTIASSRYADMKFGIFIHWGVFSVPSYGSEWFWHNYACGNNKVKQFADKNFPTVKDDYPKYADLWKAELFDADEWFVNGWVTNQHICSNRCAPDAHERKCL